MSRTELASDASGDTYAGLRDNPGDESRTRGRRKERTEASEHSERGDASDNPYQDLDDDIPPLPGNVQMWVRTSIQGQPDIDNVREYMSRGWKPRTKDSVPGERFISARRLCMDETDFGNVVAKRDRMLFERPRALHEREKAREDALLMDMNKLIRQRREDGRAEGLKVGFEAKEGPDFDFSD
jgi:hypothetical protein